MADMFDFYFRQLVTEGEFDAALDNLEAADRSMIQDQGLSGLILGGGVIENAPTANLTVNVEGPLIAYDQIGRRLAFMTSVQNVDVSQDENGMNTTVTPASGNERAVSVFIEFDRFLSDAREDGNNQTVFYSRAEGFSLNVVQGAEYTPPQDPSDLPPLRADQLLLCDITLTDGMSQIMDADIDSITRREDVFKLTGASFASTRGLIKDVLQDVADELNAIRAALANTIMAHISTAQLVENFGPTATGGIASTSTNATALVTFPVKVGDVYRGMRAFGLDTGLNGTVKLYKRAAPGGSLVLIDELNTFPGAEGVVEVIFGSPEIVIVDTNYLLFIETGAGAGTFAIEYLGILVP